MFKVALEFETIDDAENWIAAYLDGGGDQTLGYLADLDKSTWRNAPEYSLVLKGHRQCPDCRFNEISTVEEFNDRYAYFLTIKSMKKQYEVKDKNKTHKCQNCYHECNEEDIANT